MGECVITKESKDKQSLPEYHRSLLYLYLHLINNNKLDNNDNGVIKRIKKDTS